METDGDSCPVRWNSEKASSNPEDDWESLDSSLATHWSSDIASLVYKIEAKINTNNTLVDDSYYLARDL